MKTTIYLHSSKEEMTDHGQKLGLSEAAIENFKYCGYEVGIEVEVDIQTGEFEYLGIKDEDEHQPSNFMQMKDWLRALQKKETMAPEQVDYIEQELKRLYEVY